MNYSEALNEYKMFGFFEDICKIPRGSGNTAAIADYLCDFAKAKKLDYIRDNADNVIIKRQAQKDVKPFRRLFFRDIPTWFAKALRKAL